MGSDEPAQRVLCLHRRVAEHHVQPQARKHPAQLAPMVPFPMTAMRLMADGILARSRRLRVPHTVGCPDFGLKPPYS